MESGDPTRRNSETRSISDDSSAEAAIRPGTEFAGHRIESELGRGGMGVVYRARHLALDRERALKLIAPDLAADERFRARFERESRLAASVEHPNVVAVHHAGEEDGRLYLSMRLIDGTDLGTLVETEGPVAPERVAAIIEQAAAGLDAAHDRGLIHRDIKPSNLLVEGGPPDEHVYVGDFGISRTAGATADVTSTGEFLGTPDYVAPEQIEGEPIDRRVDVYSLGGVAHYLLTGQIPFPNRSEPAKLVAHTKAARPKPSALAPRVSRSVDAAIAKAMAIDPNDRYASAGRFAHALTTATSGSSRGPRIGLVPAIPRRWALLAVLAAIVAVVLSLVLADTGTGPEEGTPLPSASPEPDSTSIPVGRTPAGITAGDLKVWVANRDAGTITGIDPKTDRAEPATSVGPGSAPVSVAVGFGHVWVVDAANEELVRLDPGEGLPAMRIPVGAEPSDVVIGEQWVWVANEGDSTVSRVDPLESLVTATVPMGTPPRSIAFGEGAIWTANIEDGTVSRIDPADAATVGKPIELGGRINDLTVSSGSVWAIDNFGGVLHRIDVATGDPDAEIEVGAKPRGVTSGDGSIWVANGGDDTVTRVDAGSGGVLEQAIPVGVEPADISFGFGSAWTADLQARSATRVEP